MSGRPVPELGRGGTYPVTPEGASKIALLGSNFGEGSAPFSTPNGIARRVTDGAADVGEVNVVAFRRHSVPFSAPFAVVG